MFTILKFNGNRLQISYVLNNFSLMIADHRSEFEIISFTFVPFYLRLESIGRWVIIFIFVSWLIVSEQIVGNFLLVFFNFV